MLPTPATAHHSSGNFNASLPSTPSAMPIEPALSVTWRTSKVKAKAVRIAGTSPSIRPSVMLPTTPATFERQNTASRAVPAAPSVMRRRRL